MALFSSTIQEWLVLCLVISAEDMERSGGIELS
jgi:hypothetical protein